MDPADLQEIRRVLTKTSAPQQGIADHAPALSNRGQSGLPSLNRPAPMQAAASAAGGGAGLGIAAGINATGNVIGAAISAGATRYAADQGLAGTKYTADQSLAGTKYSADKNLTGIMYSSDKSYQLGHEQLAQQFTMWDRDYQIANKLGLYHPSQLGSILAGVPSGADTYKLSSRGLMRMPRTIGTSPFSI